MSTKAHPKFSFFDFAKNYIEGFIKGRTRTEGRMQPLGRENDRYLLLTTQSKYPENVKVLAEKNPGPVVDELRKIPLPYGQSQIHLAILDAFRVLHVNRAQTGIDGYGTGRAPQNTEQVLLIVLTDGSGVAAIPADFQFHFDPPFLGSEMTREAFRWDQKLYTVVFRVPSTPYRLSTPQMINIDIDIPNIERLCAKTGGRSFSILSIRQISTCIDHILATALQHRIGVRFDCLPAIHFTAGRGPPEECAKVREKFKKLVAKRPVTNLVSRVTPQGRPVSCHWQIPEGYFPMKNMDQLASRTTHPVILVAPEPLPLPLRVEIPVDKLELEPSAVTDIAMEMLQGRREMSIWTYIEGASNGPTAPFGCLRLNASGTGIILVLLPYNFPMFYPLVEEIVRDPHLNQSQVWRAKLDSYLQTVPYYYFNQMRVCLERLKLKVDISGSMSSMYSGQLLSNLNRLKVKAKEEWDQIGLTTRLRETHFPKKSTIRLERITSRSSIVGLASMDDEFNEEDPLDDVDAIPLYNGDHQISLYPPTVNEPETDQVYKTPLFSSVEDMVGKLNRMQANIELLFDPERVTLLDMAKLGQRARFNTLEELHNMPMKTMGEYEAYQIARTQYYGAPFKRIEEEKERTHAFGNPYKLKGLGAGIDEVMESTIDDSNQKVDGKRYGEFPRQGGGPPKRRRGPLGIDAFDQWRTQRSMRGSSAASDISEDISGLLSDVVDQDAVFSDQQPGPSSSSSSTDAAADELHAMRMKDRDMQPMDTDDTLMENLEAVMRGREAEKAQKAPPVVAAPAPPVEKLSSQEMMTRKIKIGIIVRKPANHRAYDEIMDIATGITKESSEILMRYAVRESQRFKIKQLTEKLQKKLTSI